MTNQYAYQTISALHQQLLDRKLSSVELTQSVLDQADRLNSTTHAFITIDRPHALKQAEAADKTIRSGKATMLTGIPFSMKDAYVTRHVVTTAASKVLEGYLPQYDSTVYQKLRSQHAVLIGKNNQDAWGHGGSSENTDFQTVKNPWDVSRTAGGSSGGTAAALASGATVFGIGEDTGGSIRNPSHFCGTTGLKVTYGRVSRYGAIAYASSLDTVGPMTHSVADIAAILPVIAGYDPHDASSSRQPVPDYQQHLTPSLKGKTIGLLSEYMQADLDPEVKSAIAEAAQTFARLGCQVKSVSIPTAKYGVSMYYILALSETSSNLARYDGIRYGFGRDRFTKETKRRIMLGSFSLSSGYYDAYYKKALQARTLLIEEFNHAFQKVDVILAPVMPFPAYKFGDMASDKNYITAMYVADLYTCATNPAGIPSLALPAGFSSEKLPLGMQLMGPMFAEAELLNFGYQFQQATNYHLKHPQL